MKHSPGAKDQRILDLLIVIIRQFKLLILAPLAVGVIGFTTASLKPATYTSEAILAMAETISKQASLIMVSPLVLDAVIGKLGLAKDVSLEQARDQLAGQINTKVGRDGLLWLEVSATTPAMAQQLASAVIEAWRASTVPGAQEKELLLARQAYVQKMLHSIDQSLGRLTTESPAYFDGTVTRGERSLTLLSLGELQAKYFDESQTIARKLLGASADLVRQAPSLPTRPDPMGRGKTAVLLTIATFMLLVIFLLVRHLCVLFVNDADNGAALARLRAALGGSTAAATGATASHKD